MRAAIAWVERLLAAGGARGGPNDERLRTASLVLGAAFISLLSFGWIATYFALGLPLAAAIPLAYQLATVAGIVVFLRTGSFRALALSQLALMLVLPFLLQWSLGGFVDASAVAIWAIVAPLSAVLFVGGRPAVPWFAGFLALTVVSAFIDGRLPSRGDEIPGWVSLTFFVVNFAGPAATAFLLLQHFLRALERERGRSERLLLNVLPAAVAERLKDDESRIADHAEEVTVLFADLVGFTAVADRSSPRDVVDLLGEIFSAFDELVDASGLEKIKTVGDGYMVAAGIPSPRRDHAEAAADLALAMRRRLAALPRAREAGLQLRIGLDSGPVIAGVIGRRRFSYDLWGDTVNTASRMESHARPGEIQVTERTYERLRAAFELEPRGGLEVKGKGIMRTYVLRGRRAGVEAERASEPVTTA
ncbi:MAG TPA: adenylate/guanylate cyclase domain-containing protein [Gaiellaceae bacterium]|nr:adenylate/guanylate cyclase domain-containing protein [Gaiellaceae bacterium]